MPIIELQNVTKSYRQNGGGGSIEALRGVSLAIEPGEFVALVGASGSGKTTLLNLVGGIDRPSSGRVIVKGLDLGTATDDQLAGHRRDNIGFIFQSFFLSPQRTALENVMLSLHFHNAPVSGWKASAEQALEQVGLAGYASRACSKLSGGQKQRVAIARALVTRPPILLADEPVGSLDDKTGAEILDLIRQYHRDVKATVLVVTHERRLVEASERSIEIAEGKFVLS